MNIKEKKYYRLRYQYELMEELTGFTRRQIRDKMRYRGMGNSTSDFVTFLNLLHNNHERAEI